MMQAAQIDSAAPVRTSADVSAAISRMEAARAHRLVEVERLSRIDPIIWLKQHASVVPEFTEDAGIFRVRRQPPVDNMQARKSITLRQHEAAGILFRDYVFGVCGVRDFDVGEKVPGIRGGIGDQYSVSRLDSLAAFRNAIRAMGRPITRVVVAVVCEELTLAKYCKMLGQNPQSIMGVLEAGLETLADHYRLPE